MGVVGGSGTRRLSSAHFKAWPLTTAFFSHQRCIARELSATDRMTIRLGHPSSTVPTRSEAQVQEIMKETQVEKIVDSDVSAILTRNINMSRQTATGLVVRVSCLCHITGMLLPWCSTTASASIGSLWTFFLSTSRGSSCYGRGETLTPPRSAVSKSANATLSTSAADVAIETWFTNSTAFCSLCANETVMLLESASSSSVVAAKGIYIP